MRGNTVLADLLRADSDSHHTPHTPRTTLDLPDIVLTNWTTAKGRKWWKFIYVWNCYVDYVHLNFIRTCSIDVVELNRFLESTTSSSSSLNRTNASKPVQSVCATGSSYGHLFSTLVFFYFQCIIFRQRPAFAGNIRWPYVLKKAVFLAVTLFRQLSAIVAKERGSCVTSLLNPIPYGGAIMPPSYKMPDNSKLARVEGPSFTDF